MSGPPTRFEHPIYFEDISEGMEAEIRHFVSDDDIVHFSQITGDTNPVHIDAEYAAKTRFKQRIAHGMLSAGYVSAVFGTQLPGPGAIYVNQSLRFKAPVYIGDEVVAKVIVTHCVPGKGFVEFETRCFVGDKMVLDGEATLWVPSRPSKVG